MTQEKDKNISIQDEIFKNFKSAYKKSNELILNNTNYIKKTFSNKKSKLISNTKNKFPKISSKVELVSSHPRFRIFRILLITWLIFSMSVGYTGVLTFLKINKAASQTDLHIKTGYYLGTGSTLSITGFGFTPQMIIIKADTAAGSAIWKTVDMPPQVYSYWGNATANNTEAQLTLDTDGFTVEVNPDVNLANTRYTYIAFSGNDCSSNGLMCIGKYLGDGNISKSINTGFNPDLLWIARSTASVGHFRTSAMPNNNISFLSGNLNDATGNYVKTLDPTGFTVGLTDNTNGGLYYFASFKKSAGILDVGSYTGNGVNDTVINPPLMSGKTPAFVLTKANSTQVATFNITEDWGDYSAFTSAAANAVGVIKSLQNNGFTLGASIASNQNGTFYNYFSFTSTEDYTLPNESFIMRYGSYIGNGTSQIIDGLGFSPDLVIVSSYNTAAYPVYTTSINKDLTHYFSVASVSIKDGITGMTSTGFTVGSNATVNTNGEVYGYIAFGNATTPHKGKHASDFIIGAYTGNGLARNINNLGINPDLVVSKPNYTSLAYWTSSSENSNVSGVFSAAADDVSGTLFSGLNADGFSLGNNANINRSGTMFNFFAFKNTVNKFQVGKYVGNGTASQNITLDAPGGNTLNLNPDYVWIKQTGAIRGMNKFNDISLGVNSLSFLNQAKFLNGVTGFIPNGFSVGNDSSVNTNAASYRFMAWKAPTPTSPPDIPTAISPNTTNIDLNPTLIGSNYVDANPQKNSEWQIDIKDNFLSPLWNSNTLSSGITLTVNDTNGVFSGDLSGKTELTHNTTYYWRVRYSNDIYSKWSSPISFTTNSIDTPTNLTPTTTSVVNTLSPTLTASIFSDPQIGHTASSSEWQVSKDLNFSNLSYESGEIAYTNTITIPKATLSDQTVYYWRVRYKDSSNQWSNYSLPTRFLVSKYAELNINPLFGNNFLNKGDNVNIDVQIKSTDGKAINNASATLNIYNPSGTKILDSAIMPYLSGSNGIYRYAYTVPNDTIGTYLYEIFATSTTLSNSIASSFEVKNISSTLNSIKNTVESEQTAQTNSRNEIINIKNQITSGILDAPKNIKSGEVVTIKYKARSGLTGSNLPKLTMYNANNTLLLSDESLTEIGSTGVYFINKTLNTNWGTGFFTLFVEESYDNTSDHTQLFVGNSDINSIGQDLLSVKTTTQTIKNNLDILIGAMIVTQSTINDLSPTNTSFKTALTNSTDNFYNNAVLTFNSGVLNGQTRRISTYDGTTKKITIDPALSDIPSDGDSFTIVKQNVRVEEQMNSHENSESTFRNDVINRLTNLQMRVDDIYNTLSTVNTSLDSVQNSINNIRDSQQNNYTLSLENSDKVHIGDTYRLKLSILNYESKPINASSTPNILIYDSSRNIAVPSTAMSQLSTGIYEYTFNVASSSPAGNWESVVTANMDGVNNIIKSKFWEVTGSPAQVIINSMSSITIPNISANVTITNEGNAPYEYQYEWCVVSTQTEQCSNGNNIYYGSAAKLIQPNEDFNTTLTATVPNAGNYWFKLIVHYGNQTSSATRSFVAGSSTTPNNTNTSGSGSVSSFYSNNPSHDLIYSELMKARDQLDLNSQKLSKMLDAMGVVSPTLDKLLSITTENTQDIKEIQNKVADLRAVSATAKKVIEQKTVEPIVETYMKFNSVEIHFLITNPSESRQTVKFKSYLPEEVKPEYIMNADGLKVDYDVNAKTYFVSGDISLAGKETITKKIELTDIWLYQLNDLNSIKNQAASLIIPLNKTQYEAQGVILKNDIDNIIDSIITYQDKSYSSPETHILAFRENTLKLNKAKEELEKLKNIVVESGVTKGVVGKVGGIQTFATWGIILAIVFGFCILGIFMFTMWKHQTELINELRLANAGIINNEIENSSKKLIRGRHLSLIKVFQKLIILIIFVSIIYLSVRYFSTFKSFLKIKPMTSDANIDTQNNNPISYNNINNTSATNTINNDYKEKKLETDIIITPTSTLKKLKILDTPTGWLNVRKSPDINSEIIFKVLPKEEYEFTNVEKDWYKIITNESKSGWINKNYIEIMN